MQFPLLSHTKCLMILFWHFLKPIVPFCVQVSMEDVENFRKNIHQIRYPENIFQFFAFRGGHQYFLNHNSHKDKNNVAKYATIRGLASKTIKNVFTNKKTRKHSNKFILPNIMPTSDNKIFEEDEDGSENTRPGKYNSIFLFIFLTVVSVILQNAQRKKNP